MTRTPWTPRTLFRSARLDGAAATPAAAGSTSTKAATSQTARATAGTGAPDLEEEAPGHAGESRCRAAGASRHRTALIAAGLAGAALSLALLGGCAGQDGSSTNAAGDSQASAAPSAAWDAPAPAITGDDDAPAGPSNSSAYDGEGTGSDIDSTAFVPDEGTDIVRFADMDSSELDAELASSGMLPAPASAEDAGSQGTSDSQAGGPAASSARNAGRTSSDPAASASHKSASSSADGAAASPATVAFRPADTGVQPQATLAYPYLGLTATLPQALQDAMESRAMFVLPTDAYTDDAEHVRYATLAFCPLTDEQRTREVTSLDPKAWEAELQRAGVLGVYQRDLEGRLDEITGCDSHAKLGESPDGAYVYYLSTNSQAPQDTLDLLAGIEISISEMRKLDPIEGFSAFSAGRTEGVATVGEWDAVDIDGQAHSSRELFGSAKLTLVNVLTTWCTSCVMEMPELERLRTEAAERGLDVNVVAVVLDTVDEKGRLDEFAVEQARKLRELTGAQFPFLTPDASEMNGRLTGLESFPESFFVDSEGRIVGSTYSGARTFEDWLEIVERELANLEG